MAFVQIGNRGFNSDNITTITKGYAPVPMEVSHEAVRRVTVFFDDGENERFDGDEYHAFMRWWRTVAVHPETWRGEE